jgi:phosphoglycerate kinase
MQGLKSFLDFDLKGKRVLLRADLNVPIKAGVISDDGRIRASLPTIKALIDMGASIVIIAHLGRPKFEYEAELSLAPVALRLSELLGVKVLFSPEIRGAGQLVNELVPGEILMLENIRFDLGERSKEAPLRQSLAEQLARYGDFYVGDGFGAIHRKHASVYELAMALPHAAGTLVLNELKILEKLVDGPERSYGVVLGGAKVSDKLQVIRALIEKVDLLIIGGGMLFTFLAAEGKEIGKSLVERDQIEMVQAILLRAKERGVKVLLPKDLLVAKEFKDLPPTHVAADEIGPDDMGLDIGPRSSEEFATEIAKCKTVFWNGPMGVFEFSNYASGTRVVAQALTKVDGLTVVGGGDSAAAIRALGFSDDQFGYVSTGGGASLEYLEGKTLPGVEALAQ